MTSEHKPQQTAQQSLTELQLEIAKLDSANAATKTRLEQLAIKVERQLEYPDEQANTSSLLEQIEHSIEEFEVEHPQLTGILGRVMHALSNMGI